MARRKMFRFPEISEKWGYSEHDEKKRTMVARFRIAIENT